jgi:nitric oxide reductase NorD protein
VLPPRTVHVNGHESAEIDPAREYLLIKGRLIGMDDDLRSLIEEKGMVPGGILVQGSEMGGESRMRLTDLIEEQQQGTASEAGGLLLDEWDYRRGGYRRQWCSLYETEGPAGKEPFVEQTLQRYSGAVSLIRKKFELLKRERSIQRRQKDGEEVDLDAVVESYSDLHAGISPSENLFLRIERQERNIAVLFLVDMSGSTQGWVNESEKESLVLMSEALETLGDRYAIYGFSSMTRNHCDLYRIKGFNESYGEAVKRRISGIRPRDFTRMGAFIRRAADLLNNVEARTKLLITLSDSKPEDGDGYKGDYAIEDMRKALIEAGGQGIHPFCITIDREAQSYLPHLFGAVNYIFIDDVRKLPDRITEIYCRLTA